MEELNIIWYNVISKKKKWIKDANNNGNKIESRGSGNFSSDEAKEIARLRKELKDTQDALEVLKRLLAYWENKQNRYL